MEGGREGGCAGGSGGRVTSQQSTQKVQYLDARNKAIMVTIHSNIIKHKACMVADIVRPGQARNVTTAEFKAFKCSWSSKLVHRWVLIVRQRRGHLLHKSLCVCFHSKGQVEKDRGADSFRQRVTYHCSEGYCWCGRSVHVIESVARVGIDRDVSLKCAVHDIQLGDGVCPYNCTGRVRRRRRTNVRKSKRRILSNGMCIHINAHGLPHTTFSKQTLQTALMSQRANRAGVKHKDLPNDMKTKKIFLECQVIAVIPEQSTVSIQHWLSDKST